MDAVRQPRRKRWAAAILNAGISPLEKVRKLVVLGYEEEEAERMVNGAQSGHQLIYYEQLPSPDYGKE